MMNDSGIQHERLSDRDLVDDMKTAFIFGVRAKTSNEHTEFLL